MADMEQNISQKLDKLLQSNSGGGAAAAPKAINKKNKKRDTGTYSRLGRQ